MFVKIKKNIGIYFQESNFTNAIEVSEDYYLNIWSIVQMKIGKTPDDKDYFPIDTPYIHLQMNNPQYNGTLYFLESALPEYRKICRCFEKYIDEDPKEFQKFCEMKENK